MRRRRMMMMSQPVKKPDKKKNLIKVCLDCSAACDLAIQYIEGHPEGFTDQLIKLLNDCSSYIELMAEFLGRDSEFSKPVCEVGRSICARCKEECDKYPDVAELKKVAHECEQCINACGAYLS